MIGDSPGRRNPPAGSPRVADDLKAWSECFRSVARESGIQRVIMVQDVVAQIDDREDSTKCQNHDAHCRTADGASGSKPPESTVRVIGRNRGNHRRSYCRTVDSSPSCTAEQFRLCSMVAVAVGVGDGQGNGVLDLGDQSQHQKLVLGGGNVIARYRGRLTRRAGTADIAGTVGVAGGGLTVCGGRLIAGDGVGRVIRVPLSGNGVADGGGLIGGEVRTWTWCWCRNLGVDAGPCVLWRRARRRSRPSSAGIRRYVLDRR